MCQAGSKSQSGGGEGGQCSATQQWSHSLEWLQNVGMCVGLGRGSLVVPQALPSILDSGNQKPHCFSPSECCSLSWGSWQICCWPVGWRHMGSRAWHFFRDSHCLFLVRLSSRSHAPPQQVPAILLSLALGRAKVLGEEIDRGLPPTRLLCWDPQWLIVPSWGEEVVGGMLVSKSAPGASSGWSPLHQELFAKLWESYLFEGSWMLSAKTEVLCQALGGTILKNSS